MDNLFIFFFQLFLFTCYLLYQKENEYPQKNWDVKSVLADLACRLKLPCYLSKREDTANKIEPQARS